MSLASLARKRACCDNTLFNAKVISFGLAKMLIMPGELNTMSVVIGSFGYIAAAEFFFLNLFAFA